MCSAAPMYTIGACTMRILLLRSAHSSAQRGPRVRLARRVHAAALAYAIRSTEQRHPYCGDTVPYFIAACCGCDNSPGPHDGEPSKWVGCHAPANTQPMPAPRALAEFKAAAPLVGQLPCVSALRLERGARPTLWPRALQSQRA